MKRYLIAGLVAGIVYAVLGPVFVHHILAPELRNELLALLAKVGNSGGGGGDAAPPATEPGDWLEVAPHIAVRLVWGFVTMAAFAWLQRRRPRFAAACIAGAVGWFLFYVVLPSVMAARHGMSVTLFCVCVGYGLIETQLASFAGMVTWGKPAPTA